MRSTAVALLLAIAACGCTSQSPAYPVASFWLGITCQGGAVAPQPGLHLVLHGAMDSGSARTWVGDSTVVKWPAGYVARFEPSLVIYDASGVIRGREGEDLAATSPWHGQTVCMDRDESMHFTVYVFPATT